MNFKAGIFVSRHLRLFGLMAVWLCFFVIARLWIDPDFGWHIRIGSEILRHGIFFHDPLSYTMPSYPYVDLEWLTNILLSIGYTYIGWGGLAFVFATLTILSGWVCISKKYREFIWVPFLFFLSVAVSRFGIRVQVLSWLFVSVLLRLLGKEDNFKAWSIGFPMLMIFWVNMHGSFPLGLGISGVALIGKYIQTKKIPSQAIVGFILGLLTTFINPYGWRVWQEVWMQLSDRQLSHTIIEWAPFWARLDLSLWVALGAVIVFAWILRKDFETGRLFIAISLFLLALTGVRHTPLALLGFIPIICIGLLQMRQLAVNKNAVEGERRFAWFHKVLILFSITLFTIEFLFSYVADSKFTQANGYPSDAIAYIQKHTLNRNILFPYVWGGYAEWKIPNLKVFVDGRMPSFRFYPPTSESASAFHDYLALINGKNVQKTLSLYNVHTIVWPQLKISRALYVFKAQTNLNYIQNSPDLFPDNLKTLGWKVEYEDSIAIILTHQ